MLHSNFLKIASRESAIKTIRRTSNYFIWISIIVLAANLLPHFDSWSQSPSKANSTGSAEIVGSLIGFMLGRIVFNDWPYILFLLNGFALRRYKSRVAAILFFIVGVYGIGLGLFVLWKTLQASPVSSYLVIFGVFFAVVSALSVLVAGRALAAAIKLRGEFKENLAVLTTAG